eukprot:CAMPEP_0184644474 /NCGR_PEP_ID=MMETSP0308-20130426/1189_1 /TAXON_ID=38269 /ORGANISM="Gloeochaete witrockiana, Strain SAG 46.84" /LENGTH=128 /DNA_ID=CAMNT_0027073025 /DNA_START=118 /DNA_END=504 /DNA_ORIENTATION=+
MTNFELFEFLSRGSSERKARAEIRTQIEDQVLEYLKRTPAATQDTQSVARYISAIDTTFEGLTTPEKLQLINLRPTTLVEIHLIVEECEERLQESQTLYLLSLTAECLPEPISIQSDSQAPPADQGTA